MHMAEGEAQGLNYNYRLMDVGTAEFAGRSLAEMVDEAHASGFAGLNVTYPYKVEIIPLLDELSATADAVSAVNTVVFKGGKRYGQNTDAWGFAESMRRKMPNVSKTNVVLLGAGGAGCAVAHALMNSDVGTLIIYDSDTDKASKLAAKVCQFFGSGKALVTKNLSESIAVADGLVNATPMGMASNPGMAVPVEVLRSDLWVADIVYFPLETELLRNARAVGCQTMSGEGMAVNQAVRAFELFCGRKPEIKRMEAAFAAFDQTVPA